MKLFRTLFVAGLVQVAALSAAHAQSGLDQIKSAGVLVRHRGHLRPFTFHEASGQLVGFDVDIGRAIAQRLGVKAEFVEGKWDGLIAGLDAKRYDAVINQVGITDARKAKYDFSDPYISSAAVLIVRDDNTTIKSFEDLKGRKSANTLTSNFGKLAQRHGADLVAVQGFNESIDLLTSGRVEATVNDNLSYLDFRSRSPTPRSRSPPPTRPPSSAARACCCARATPSWSPPSTRRWPTSRPTAPTRPSRSSTSAPTCRRSKPRVRP